MAINYDISSKGGTGFDMDDYKHLKSLGYKQSDIDSFAKSQKREDVGAQVSLNTGAYKPSDESVKDLSKYDVNSLGGNNGPNGPNINNVEIQHLMNAGGHSAQELNDWSRQNNHKLTKKAQQFLSSKLYGTNPGNGGGNNNGDNRDNDNRTGDGGNNGGGGSGGSSGGGGGGGGSTVDVNNDNSQTVSPEYNNPINANITGDRNNQIINQDNSVRNYGGDNRTFTYSRGGGGGGQYGAGGSWFDDDPVSQATAAGYYEVDDSPAKQAKFTDMYSDLNKQNQKRFAGQGLNTANMFSNFDARNYEPRQMEAMINESTQRSYDKANDEIGYTFGDIWRPDYAPPKWAMPDPPEEIKNDDGLGDEETDRIENQ